MNRFETGRNLQPNIEYAPIGKANIAMNQFIELEMQAGAVVSPMTDMRVSIQNNIDHDMLCEWL